MEKDENVITDKMRNFEALMRLKSMKEGEPITWQHMEAVNFFFKDIIAKLPEPKVIGAAYFKGDTIMRTGILAESEIVTGPEPVEKDK